MELNKLYKSILRFAGMEVDDGGLVYLNAGDERRPALMNGVRLVLPTDEILRSPPSKDRVVFHPLSENTLLGESEVISHLLKVMNIRLNMTFGILGCNLLQLIASPELHKRLDPDQAELLIQIKDVDDLAVTNFSSIMINAIKIDNEDIYSNIFLRRGGVINGKKYARAGFTKFKMYEELLKDPTELFGVKLRVKDRAILKSLHEFIFPEIATKNAYDVGSSSHVAPFLDALMRTALGLATNLNDLLVQYKDFIDNCDDLLFDSEWLAAFEDLDSMRSEIRRVPAQVGNDGRVAPANAAVNLPSSNSAQAERDRAALTIPGSVNQQVRAEPVQQVMQQPAPTQAGAWPTVRPAATPAMVASGNVAVAAPVQAPVQHVQQQYHQPLQQQAAPQVQMTSRGIDYASMMNVNPALRPPMPGMMPGQQMQPIQQPLTLPGWAGSLPQVQQPQQMMVDAYGRPVMMQQQQPMQNQAYWPSNQMQQQQPQQFGYPPVGGVVRI